MRYTGEFSSVAGAAEVCTALAVQSLSFLLYSVVFVLLPRTGRGGYIPPSATAAAATASGSSNNNASSSDAGVGDTQQPGPPPTALATLRVKVCLSAGFLSSWLVCGYWVYAMNEMKAKHGKHWQLDVALLWLPLGGPLYGFLVGYVLHAMQGIATDIDALRRQRYKYKKV